MVNSNKKKRKNSRKNKNNVADPNPENSIDEGVQELSENEEQFERQGKKRDLPTEDSDNDDQPRKKKKKKLLLPNSGSDKKGEKSIRQTKREKHAQRLAEAAAVSKDQLKSQCHTYLSQWKHNRSNWKFMKVKQAWLYKNKFSSVLLPDSLWPVFLEYFESAKGNIRNMLLEDANKVIKEMDEWTDLENNSENNKNTDGDEEKQDDDAPKKPDSIAYKRARDLIQCLEE